MMKLKVVFSVLILFLGISISCSESSVFVPIDKRAENIGEIELQLKAIYTKAIAPINLELLEKISTLKTSASLLTSNNTQQQLENVQTDWIEVATTWRKAELFNIGPINGSFIHYTINRWPIDQEKIEDYISTETNIPIDFAQGIGSSSKGIASLEYLLFESDFSFDANDKNKIAYINSVVTELENNFTTLKNLWETYQEEFITSTEVGITGGQNRIHNAISGLIEKINISKIGKPIENIENTPIEYLEAGYSEKSLTFVKTNFEIIKFCFVDEDGFNSYLTKIEEPELVVEINNALATCELELNNFTGSFKNSLATKNTAHMENLKDAFNTLLKITKTDMAAVLGNTITISDNDGD